MVSRKGLFVKPVRKKRVDGFSVAVGIESWYNHKKDAKRGSCMKKHRVFTGILVVLLAAIFIIINTIIDISYLYLDPRIRKAQGGL